MIGKTITGIRPMTRKEAEAFCWDEHNVAVIELEDGSIIIPSMDTEGNGPGELFHQLTDGQVESFPVVRQPRARS